MYKYIYIYTYMYIYIYTYIYIYIHISIYIYMYISQFLQVLYKYISFIYITHHFPLHRRWRRLRPGTEGERHRRLDQGAQPELRRPAAGGHRVPRDPADGAGRLESTGELRNFGRSSNKMGFFLGKKWGNPKFHPRFWFGNMFFGKVVGTSMDIRTAERPEICSKVDVDSCAWPRRKYWHLLGYKNGVLLRVFCMVKIVEFVWFDCYKLGDPLFLDMPMCNAVLLVLSFQS